MPRLLASVASEAARSGSLSCLTFALDGGGGELTAPVGWSEREREQLLEKVAREAARGGSVPCLKLALERGGELNARMAASAAYGGHVACLRWLHARGCPWDSESTETAIVEGRLECLLYAHENGCALPQRMACSRGARARGYQHGSCLQYAIDHGVELDLCGMRAGMRDLPAGIVVELRHAGLLRSLIRTDYRLPRGLCTLGLSRECSFLDKSRARAPDGGAVACKGCALYMAELIGAYAPCKVDDLIDLVCQFTCPDYEAHIMPVRRRAAQPSYAIVSRTEENC